MNNERKTTLLFAFRRRCETLHRLQNKKRPQKRASCSVKKN
jgi:hypothetical protein